MSKQTNDFQKLVTLVQKALAPAGAKVTESAMVDHQGHAREIDVLVESNLGVYQMKIAVEVKDHSRPLGPGIIEEYIGKYRQGDGISVNQVVVVSRNGFTRSARDKARNAGIILFTLCEAKSADWKKLIKTDTPKTLRFQVQPHFHKITFEPTLPFQWQQAMLAGSVTCACCNKHHGLFAEFVNKQIEKIHTQDPGFRQSVDAALKEHHGNALAHLRICTHNKVLHLDGQTHRFDHITLDIHFTSAEAPLEFTVFKQTDGNGNSRLIQQATAVVAGKKITLVMPDGPSSKQIVLDIHDAADCNHPKTSDAA